MQSERRPGKVRLSETDVLTQLRNQPVPHLFDRYFFLVDIGNVPLTISVTPCSSIVSMTILWRTMPDDKEYYYYDDDDDYDIGMYIATIKQT